MPPFPAGGVESRHHRSAGSGYALDSFLSARLAYRLYVPPSPEKAAHIERSEEAPAQSGIYSSQPADSF
jgi:hypothetical protein